MGRKARWDLGMLFIWVHWRGVCGVNWFWYWAFEIVGYGFERGVVMGLYVTLYDHGQGEWVDEGMEERRVM